MSPTFVSVPFDSDEAMDAMESWPMDDKMNAARDAALFGNVYVGPQGEYVPAGPIHWPESP